MTTRFQIGYPLSILPNAHGFRFRGVEENGDLLPCIVEADKNGLHHIVCENTGARVFYKLRGWMQWLPRQTSLHDNLPCRGTNCGVINSDHSPECIVETAQVRGWLNSEEAKTAQAAIDAAREVKP